MSDTTETQPETETETFDERTLLMQRARLMGITISNNIGLEKLRAKIAAAQAGEKTEPVNPESEEPVPAKARAAVAPPRELTVPELRQKLQKEALRLVRLRITNLDPKKKDLPGEIITVASKYIGTVRKFVPFGEATENGFHVPYCIYELLKERKFLHIRVVKRNGQEVVQTTDEREFALEILPQLTEREIKNLALKQAAAAGTVDAQ